MLHQPGILGILHGGTLLNQTLELMYAINLKQGVYGVTRLVDNILPAAIYIVVHARCRINLNGCQYLQHIKPVIRHGPPPLVGIGIIWNDVPKIIQQNTRKRFSHRQRYFCELQCPVIPKLHFHTHPMRTRLTVSFRCLVVDAYKNLALRRPDLHRGAFGTKNSFPIVAAADIVL